MKIHEKNFVTKQANSAKFEKIENANKTIKNKRMDHTKFYFI